jgi:hypothetical protein
VQDYLYNFFVWWYAVKLRELIIGLRKIELTLLRATYTVDMIKNFNQPIYQDFSTIGRMIGFVIRGVWIIGGLIIMLVAMIPFTVVAAIYALLPFIVVSQVVLGLLIVFNGLSL